MKKEKQTRVVPNPSDKTKPDGYTLLGEVKGCGTFHRAIMTPRPDQPDGVCWFCNQP